MISPCSNASLVMSNKQIKDHLKKCQIKNIRTAYGSLDLNMGFLPLDKGFKQLYITKVMQEEMIGHFILMHYMQCFLQRI